LKKHRLLCTVLLAQLGAGTFGQQPSTTAPTPPQQPSSQEIQKPGSEDVVRITTNLVQVDAVVTDKNGKIVTDLKPEEIKILEDGREQKITNFAYYATETVPESARQQKPAAVDKNAPVAPPTRLRPEDVRRTIAIVVDDLGLSFESTHFVQSALKKFVDEQMQPGDLVAIIRTGAGVGALQQFTSDKNQVERAIKAVRWQPSVFGFGCTETFQTAHSDYTVKTNRGGGTGDSAGASTFEDEASRRQRERMEDLNREALTVRTLGTLRYVMRGLQDLPGRKSTVLISDGLPIFSRAGHSDSALDNLQRLVNIANHASVVLYTMDARGVFDATMITAADEVLPNTPGNGGASSESEILAQSRSDSVAESRSGLNYLAAETGGLFIHDTNKLDNGISRALEDQRSYYLIGYRPTEFTRKQGSNFRKLTVKVKRPGLNVRYRHGFFGPTGDPVAPKPQTADSRLYAALASPLAASGVSTRLTAFFGNDQRSGSFMRSLMHIDARDVTFASEPNGWKKLVLDVAAVTFGENGKVVDEFNRTHTIRTAGETLQEILKNGLVYSADIPVKKPGAYQLRMVVRDSASQRVGSASQFIEVPEFKKDNLALSGLVISEANAKGAPALPPNASADAALSPIQSASNLAVRIFHSETVMSYGYLIYNPRLDPQTHKPQLTTQVSIFREGQLMVEGPETPYDIGQQTDLTRLRDDGFFKLNKSTAPGQYVLQITVKDVLPNAKPRTVTQWIDFEVVN